MYQRPHHQLIQTVLNALDADLLRSAHCYFGGGTAIALMRDEFRESRDIDFLVSDWSAFQELRELVKKHGPRSLFTTTEALHIPEYFSNDEYGIRGWVSVNESPIKFEIVHEGRISLTMPGPTDRVGLITTLTEADMVAEKLMANSDRGADKSTFQRDLIDLAFITVGPVAEHTGFEIAQSAYGHTVTRDLDFSAARLIDDSEWLERCLRSLSIRHELTEIRKRIGQVIGSGG